MGTFIMTSRRPHDPEMYPSRVPRNRTCRLCGDKVTDDRLGNVWHKLWRGHPIDG